MSEVHMVEDATPKKVAFANRKYSNEERVKKEEEELERLKKEREDSLKTSDSDEDKEEGDEEPDNAEERSFKKRYGDLRRHSQKKEQELQKQIDELKASLESTTKQELKMPTSEDELEGWTKEYPQVASIIETIAMKKAKDMSTDLKKQLEEINAFRADATKEKAEAELMRIHPDFDKIRDDDAFHDWVDEQPQWIKDALYDNDTDARAAARAIDLYKADMNIAKKNKAKPSAADAIDNKAERNIPLEDERVTYIKESDVSKMSDKEYEKRADEIREAMRAGKFIYDVTGSAR